MESLTTCSICCNKFSQNIHVPLVLTCGHTFCKECVAKFTKCPHCRKVITSTTTNLIIFQISCTSGGHCEHKLKRLFCPVCACPLCISCVPSHNMHGIIPLNDPSLASSLTEKLKTACEKLLESNNSLFRHLENISQLKSMISEKEFKICEKIRKKFENVFQCLALRKQEILDEVESIYRPISSKLDTLVKELESAIENNKGEIQFIQHIQSRKIKSQIKLIRPFKVKFINPSLVEKISIRSKKAPLFLVEIEKVLKEIQLLGGVKQENSKKIFGFRF